MASEGQSCDVTTHVIRTALIRQCWAGKLSRYNDINYLYLAFVFFPPVPSEIEARGERAQLAYQSALKDGAVNVYRGRVFLIGQDRAGKTSLKKSLIGLPFNLKEKSTEGIEVDRSKFQLDVDAAKNWQPIPDENKQGFLGCSNNVAQMVVKRLCNIPGNDNWAPEEKEPKEKALRDLQNDDKNKKQFGTDEEQEKDFFVNQVCQFKYRQFRLTTYLHFTKQSITQPQSATKLLETLHPKETF